MKCPNCQCENAVGARFCSGCGATLSISDEPVSLSSAPTMGRKEEPKPSSAAKAEPEAEAPSFAEAPTLRDAAIRAGHKFLGRYTVLGELGRGGMGVVYKCRDEIGKINVALKALPPEISHNSGEMEEVRENFQLVSRLKHPNIAAVNTIERDPGSGDFFLILELIEGTDLRRWRKKEGGKVSLEKALPILRQIAQALDFAHSKKIIHRDIKPGNIMLASDGTVKVLDFGLAAQIQSSMSRVSQAHFSTSGTAPYMSPEQWRGKEQNGATDQYALAVTAYELIKGRLPFDSQDPIALRESAIHETPDKPEELTDKQWAVLSRALAKEPAQRFANCVEFVDALEKAQSATPSSSSRRKEALTSPLPEARPPKSQSLLTSAPTRWGAVASVVILAGLGWYFGIAAPESRRKAELAKIEAQARAASDAKEKARLEAEAERLSSEREKTVAAAKAKEESDARERERLAAEAKAKVDAETERQRAEAKAKDDAALAQAQAEARERLRLAKHKDAQVSGTVEAKRALELSAKLEKVPYPTLDSPYENSLGMKFAPVAGTEVLFGVWDVRVKDFEAFVNATGHDATQAMFTFRGDGMKPRGDTWKSPGFEQGPTHPVVGVSWEDAHAFCAWLTKKERTAGLISENQNYRLPKDREWSIAVGGDPFPWGTQWPPPSGAGNFAGSEVKDGKWSSDWKTIKGWKDGFARTSPVGSFRANKYGLYDMSGNVWQWCEDWYRKEMNTKEIRKNIPGLEDDGGGQASLVLRGGSWWNWAPANLLSSSHDMMTPAARTDTIGFRVVLAGVGSAAR